MREDKIIIGLIIFLMIAAGGGILFELVKDFKQSKISATITKTTNQYGSVHTINYTYKNTNYAQDIKDNKKFNKYENGDKLKIHVDEDEPTKFRLPTPTYAQIAMILAVVLLFAISGIITKKEFYKN